MPTNYRQIYAVETKNKALIKKLFPMQDKAGIYAFYRTDENGDKFAYIGQAVKMLTRCASHLVGYKKKNPTHIDLSLFKRKLYNNENNPYGWKVTVARYCKENELDKYEQAYIKAYQDNKVTLLNVTGGGQFDKKQDINERYQPNLKRYKSGKSKGYEQCLTEVRTYFDKYLDFAIKPPTNKIKERKAKEFKKFLEGEQ